MVRNTQSTEIKIRQTRRTRKKEKLSEIQSFTTHNPLDVTRKQTKTATKKINDQ